MSLHGAHNVENPKKREVVLIQDRVSVYDLKKDKLRHFYWNFLEPVPRKQSSSIFLNINLA